MVDIPNMLELLRRTAETEPEPTRSAVSSDAAGLIQILERQLAVAREERDMANYAAEADREYLTADRDRLAAENERLTRERDAWASNAKDARSVIAMIRAMIGEMFGPVIESEEATLLRGPEPKHDGEAIVEALSRILSSITTAPAEVSDEMVEALKSTTASLVAATSLLKRGDKKAAPSDKMFDQMILDYEKSIDVCRSVLQAVAARGKG